MAAWRCSICSVNYPVSMHNRAKNIHPKCAACGDQMSYYTNLEPDPGWGAHVKGFRDKERALHERPAVTEPHSPHPVNDSIQVIYREDTDSVHVLDAHLRKIGYNDIEVGDVVRLNGNYYELLGYHVKSTTWWLDRFSFEKELRQIKRLPVAKGPTSDDILFLDDTDPPMIVDTRKKYDPMTDNDETALD